MVWDVTSNSGIFLCKCWAF